MERNTWVEVPHTEEAEAFFSGLKLYFLDTMRMVDELLISRKAAEAAIKKQVVLSINQSGK